ncbi:nuclear pore complex subunit [Zalaria obscura]|uniref:Nuclear pore complex subunit n=1 Tax=Zalaria obscura TaxID=2024903 RepID=A0ACC3S2V2_9PEZI
MSLFGNLGQNKPAAPSGGLFGNLGGGNNTAATPPQSGGSLFGTATSQPAQSGGLFSNLGNTQTPQTTGASSGGLFGASGSQPAQASGGSGLFGGLGGGQQAPATSTPSLFGTSTSQPAATSSGGGLFGASTTTPAPAASGGLFGRIGASNTQSQPAQSTAAPSGGLFSGIGASTAQPQQQNNPNQNQQSQLGQSQASAAPAQGSKPAYFDHLLERSKKRNAENGAGQFGEIPSLQLGLGDIARKVRNLGQGGPGAQRDGRADSRAHYLLAASGINTGTALRDLNNLSTEAAARPATPANTTSAFDQDLDSYVEGIYRQSTLNLIEQGLEQAKRDFDDFLEENVQMEWDSQRRRIYEHFGLVRKGDDLNASRNDTEAAKGAFGRSSRRGRGLGASLGGMSFGASGMQKSVLGTPSTRGARPSLFNDVAEKAPAGGLQPAPEDRMLRDKQDKYGAKVQQLNVRRLEEAVYPIFKQFSEVEAQPSIEDTSNFVNAYNALAEIVGEKGDVQSPSDPGAVRERQFATDYLDDAPTSSKAFALRKRIINGSRRYLEKQFLTQVKSNVDKNPREANLGGVPTSINLVRGYIRLRSARKELGADNVELQSLGDDYCWVLIFYLLRCGLVNEAAQYVAENERAIKSMDRNFPNYLASYAKSEDRRLSQDLQSRITSEYSQRARIAPENSLDPYRMACYKLVGRCELSRRTLEGVNQSMEDWIWLQFALAREVNRVEETAGEVFALEDVRGVIQEIGQRHFMQGGEVAGGYSTYFFLQILAGQFESAIAWLYPHNYLTAVHFSIALNFYGLLRVNDFNGGDDLLSYTTRHQPQLSFGRMIGYYTRDFRATNATYAADYLCLIHLNSDLPGEPGRKQAELCHEALRELVLETREFAQLLGDIRSDGQRIKGAIEQRLKLIGISNERNFLRQITVAAAQIAEENGRVTDAVLLFHLAEEYNRVIEICNRAVSDAVAVELGDAPVRLEPLKPRDVAQPGAEQQAQKPDSSLSLTAVEDPVQLTRNMFTLYESNALSAKKIKPANRDACQMLLLMAEARSFVEQGRWALALDKIHSLNLLPLSASGSVSLIRDRATTFNTLPSVLSRNVGNLLIWTITCCGNQRDTLRKGEYDTPDRQQVADELLQAAKDTMVFAGLIRYKLQPRVFEVLARVGGDVGAY